ncbi:FKBP-type peptidyl-prolyl cis-trans isomerase FkpA [Cnuella takakiae]|uniref:Peptidyl-prolyl cis-trans isomerase n=1 Tax=Cnuella takakiae TaxID=1302690 RepID=A0A1M4VAG2_9BACT|nr:FKBP-type peptidyl-prolyl cis-trans isomerase [Cnuella takakiae]OLY92659.1 hypothetical protein BUE76_12745 [Cnuella takakiae]SHE65883.1 FKBP-type peptidyl-prolyl cis-trans isomerase FkpA [Cnuella takakiae]
MKRFFALAAIGFAFAGCFKNGEDSRTCNYDPCGYKAPQAEIDSVKAILARQGITNATEHCSGLFYVVDSMGNGAVPSPCDQVAVRYKGMLKDGSVFDQSNTTSGWAPVGGFIPGWINGLPLIKQGGGMRLYIPPSLGYGKNAIKDRVDTTKVIIPANSVLIFEVKLDGVWKS